MTYGVGRIVRHHMIYHNRAVVQHRISCSVTLSTCDYISLSIAILYWHLILYSVSLPFCHHMSYSITLSYSNHMFHGVGIPLMLLSIMLIIYCFFFFLNSFYLSLSLDTKVPLAKKSKCSSQKKTVPHQTKKPKVFTKKNLNTEEPWVNTDPKQITVPGVILTEEQKND